MNYRALGGAVVACLVIAALEVVLGTDGLQGWYGELEKPAWHLPIVGFVAVAALVYLLQGFIAYRLLSLPLRVQERVIGLTSLVIVMLFNALWNYALFTSQNTLIGLLGLIAFVAPLAILQVALWFFDRKAGILHMAYVAWVVLYDIPLYLEIWRLNPR